MEKFKIFYSWQSDTNKRINNFYIKDSLQKAIKSIKKEVELDLSLDKDTKNTSGSPHIVETIFKKISTSDIFVCDLTIINSNWLTKKLNFKKTPNPNVLIELGYAVKVLGWERIICVVNTSLCEIEDLPFDIKQNRVSTYSLTPKNLKNSPKDLINLFKGALKAIINNYDEILENFRSNDTNQHDIKNFDNFKNIFDENKLTESLEFTSSNLITNQYYYRFWDRISDFLKNTDNHFIDESLNESLENFTKSLNEFSLLCTQYFIPDPYTTPEYLADYEDKGIEFTKEIEERVDNSTKYRFPKEPFDGDWTTYNKNHKKVQTEIVNQSFEVEEKYKIFRKLIKEKLLI